MVFYGFCEVRSGSGSGLQITLAVEATSTMKDVVSPTLPDGTDNPWYNVNWPGDKEFLESVREEAEYQVCRLRNHSSIGLWCGNNEIASGWLSWGWKEELPISVWQDYKKLFHELLPKVCHELDPERFYWPSSPGHGIDQSDEDQIYGKGDNHYWGVWHGTDPFSEFENNVSRFVSEYGFQSYPESQRSWQRARSAATRG